MKKSFSLMEVLIAISILSVVMVALLKVKSDNIFLVKNADSKAELNDYVLLSMNLKEASKVNENVFLDRLYRFDDDTLRQEIKSIKVKMKDTQMNTQKAKNDVGDLNITTYSRSYSVSDKIKKNIYSFKIEL